MPSGDTVFGEGPDENLAEYLASEKAQENEYWIGYGEMAMISRLKTYMEQGLTPKKAIEKAEEYILKESRKQ